MSCDVGEVKERLGSFSKLSVTSLTSQFILILQAFRPFIYVTTHSPTLPSLHLRHNSFSNPSLASPTSQLILQPFRSFTYVTDHSLTLLSPLLRHRFSLTSPGEPPMSSTIPPISHQHTPLFNLPNFILIHFVLHLIHS